MVLGNRESSEGIERDRNGLTRTEMTEVSRHVVDMIDGVHGLSRRRSAAQEKASHISQG